MGREKGAEEIGVASGNITWRVSAGNWACVNMGKHLHSRRGVWGGLLHTEVCRCVGGGESDQQHSQSIDLCFCDGFLQRHIQYMFCLCSSLDWPFLLIWKIEICFLSFFILLQIHFYLEI